MFIAKLQATCAALLLLGAGSASAVVVTPGSTQSLPGTTYAAEPYLGGTVLVDDITNVSFLTSSGASFTAKVQERVVRETGTGYLDFYWRVFDLGSDNTVAAFRLGNFVYDTFDANYRTDGSGVVAPTEAHRFSGSDMYDINFLFGGAPLTIGGGSRFFFLHTTATRYAETAFFDLAQPGTGLGISPSFATFAPAVPEPETYAMMMAGLGMVGFMARRRRQM